VGAEVVVGVVGVGWGWLGVLGWGVCVQGGRGVDNDGVGGLVAARIYWFDRFENSVSLSGVLWLAGATDVKFD